MQLPVDLRKDPLTVLHALGGYYECPKSPTGERLGPLVGYAGTYDVGDGRRLQYVGDVYANFAQAEQHPEVYGTWAARMGDQLQQSGVTVFMGMPMGGILVAQAMARVMGVRVIYPEKMITALKTATSREQSKLVLNRHTLEPSDRVIIAEDVTNNFSTTAEALNLIRVSGAMPLAIASFFNRSPVREYAELPVISLVFRTLPEYRQDDEAVVRDIATGNVKWKPKDQEAWPALMEAMCRK